jgi:hypothetical protein
VSSSHALNVTAGAVVEQFPVRPRQIHRQDLDRMAASLLELCSGYESALRTSMAMQRHLERVRCSDQVSAEAVLLLEEISRQLQDLTERATAVSERVQATTADLEAIRTRIG